LVSRQTKISSRFDPVGRETEKPLEAGGEGAAAALVAKLGAKFEILASWPTISTLSADARNARPRRRL
jgi:hypothetical protein